MENRGQPPNAHVIDKIEQFEKLAPLHNKCSVEVVEPLRRRFPNTSIYAIFDTAFHRTIPQHASTYAIPLDLAQRHQIRRYGFHGISHRYLLERYAHLAGRDPKSCNIVSMHLESGCSVTAIEQGRSNRQYDGPYATRGTDDGHPVGRSRSIHCGSVNA